MNETKDEIDILNTPWKTKVTPDQSAEIKEILEKNNKGKYGIVEFFNTLYFYSGTLYLDKYKHLIDRVNKFKELSVEYIIAALRKLDEGDKTVSEEKKDDEGWISVKDSLPSPNRKIQIKITDEKILNAMIENHGMIFSCQLVDNPFDGIAYGGFTHWRYKKERKPDFGKLREGDLVIVQCENYADSKVGYVKRLNDHCIFTSRYHDTKGNGILNDFSEIKKITRINLETKEFEEI